MKAVSAFLCLALAGCSTPLVQRLIGHPPPAAGPALPAAPPIDAAPLAAGGQDAAAPAAAPAAATPAAAATPVPGQTLGTTLATLGAPGEQGLWIKTPLVSAPMQGSVRWQDTTIGVQLRPSGGTAGSGSQISLDAMRLLGAPLTGIVELTVIAGG